MTFIDHPLRHCRLSLNLAKSGPADRGRALGAEVARGK
jgi:hypothetical protein